MENNIEELQKVYVESEIINYHYHKRLIQRCQREIDRSYSNMQVLPSGALGGSVIKRPETTNNSQEASNRILWLYIEELDSKIAVEQSKLAQIDEWLSKCCRSDNQERMMRRYMIDNLCRDAEGVAEELGYSVDIVKKTKMRLVDRIICNYF